MNKINIGFHYLSNSIYWDDWKKEWEELCEKICTSLKERLVLRVKLCSRMHFMVKKGLIINSGSKLHTNSFIMCS